MARRNALETGETQGEGPAGPAQPTATSGATDEGLSPPATTPKQSRASPSWPVVDFDPKALADPTCNREGRDTEWKRLYRALDPHLRAYFETVTSEELVDDVVAETWRRALRKIHDLRDPGSLFWWMVRIGKNWLKDQRISDNRRQQREQKYAHRADQTDDDLETRLLGQLGAEVEVEGRVIDGPHLREAVSNLSLQNRAFLQLYVVEELPHADVARRLGLPSADASKARWHWLKKKLRDELWDGAG